MAACSLVYAKQSIYVWLYKKLLHVIIWNFKNVNYITCDSELVLPPLPVDYLLGYVSCCIPIVFECILFVLKQKLHGDNCGLVHSGTSIWGHYKLPEIAECGKLFYQNLCCILYSPLKEYPGILHIRENVI